MTSLNKFQTGVIALVTIALIAGALALAMDGFQDSIEDDNPCTTSGFLWNSSADNCYNSSNTSQTDTNFNEQYDVTVEGLEGVGNATSYLSTIGTLLGVAALIAIVIGAFYVMRR